MRRGRFPYGFILLLAAGFIQSPALQAQNNTLYFMHPVPQAIHLNPALYYRCRTYIEIPVLSTIRYSYANTGFGYHDAMHYGAGSNADSIIIDVDNLEKKLKKRNYIRNDVTLNILGAGFRIMGEYYVHFNVSLFTETREGFPGDLVALKDGNWDLINGEPMDIDLGGLSANVSSYLQFAAGISMEWMDGLYLGATLKYLKGAANVTSRRTDLMLETEGDPMRITATSNYSIRGSFPVELSYDSLGFVSDADFSNSFANIVDDYILNKNHGAGIDVGVIYEYDDRLTLAASLVDLGFIHWGSNAKRFDANASVDFMGFDLRAYAATGGSTDFLEALVDSVLETFRFETVEKPYFSALVPKLYTGASYQVYPKLGVSALLRTEFFDLRPHFALTLAGMYNPLPFLHGTLSYSIMNNKLSQLGVGLAMGGKGAQFYLAMDHIPIRWVRDSGSGAIWPYNARTVNFRLGVNVIFGCDEQERGKYGGKGRRPGRRGKYCPAYD